MKKIGMKKGKGKSPFGEFLGKTDELKGLNIRKFVGDPKSIKKVA